MNRVGQTEVHHHDSPLLVLHDVSGLQIAVDHALGVGCFEGEAYLLNNIRGLLGRKLAASMQDVNERFAVDVLHGDELDALGFAKVKDPNHIAVSHLPGEDQFLLESLDQGWITGIFLSDRL
jgi:hypothetical protein